jgi:hypothetical protein
MRQEDESEGIEVAWGEYLSINFECLIVLNRGHFHRGSTEDLSLLQIQYSIIRHSSRAEAETGNPLDLIER